MKAPFRPRAIAFGQLGLFAAFSFVHLPFMWLVRNVHRYVPHLGGDPARLEPLKGVLGVWGLFALLSAVVLCGGLVFLRLRTAPRPPPVRQGPVRGFLQTLLVLLAVATWTWPLAILLPAARRRGVRSAARRAALGGAALLAVPVLAAVSYWTPRTSLFWPACAAWYLAGAILPGAALRLEDPYPRRLGRLLGLFFALAAAASLATHPALHVPALRAGNAARLQTLLDRAGCTLAPGAPLPGATPPVPDDRDPLSAPVSDRIAEAGTALSKITSTLHPKTRPGPLDADTIAVLSAFFDAHPDATAAAEAAAAPGYRSSLHGATTPGDFPKRLDPREESMDFFWIEPRLPHEFLTLSRLLAWRARLAFARGDADAGLADLARLDQLARTAARECLLIGALVAEAIHGAPIDTGAFAENLAAWPADALRDAVRAADAWTDLADARWPDWFGGEMLFGALWLDTLPPSAAPLETGWHNPDFRLPTVFAPYGEWWRRSDQDALYRHASDFLDRFLPACALPSGPDRDAAHRAIAGWIKDAEADLPLGARLQYTIASFMEPLNNHLPVRVRGEADYVRTAAAIELYRRDHAGTPPPDLETLVPGYLPAVPLAPPTGAPLAYAPVPGGFRLDAPSRFAAKPPVSHIFASAPGGP